MRQFQNLTPVVSTAVVTSVSVWISSIVSTVSVWVAIVSTISVPGTWISGSFCFWFSISRSLSKVVSVSIRVWVPISIVSTAIVSTVSTPVSTVYQTISTIAVPGTWISLSFWFSCGFSFSFWLGKSNGK